MKSNALRNKVYLIMVLLSFVFNTKSMIFDNRYFPLYIKQRLRDICAPSSLSVQTFFMYADHCFARIQEIGLPEINGLRDEVNMENNAPYDQAELARAIVLTGRSDTNPLRSDLRDRRIPWGREGILTAQGVAFYWEQAIDNTLSLGLTALFMHYNNVQEFLFNDYCLNGPDTNVNPGEKDYLFLVNQRISNLLNLEAPVSCDTGFGDIDLYLRYGRASEYIYKLRRSEVGFRLGLIVPTAHSRDINNPASLPIGGNGHWGIYGAFDAELELREDLVLGLYSRLSKRFARCGIHRMPALTEPSFYGSIVGPASIDPGLTFVFAPYGRIECLRDALGVGVGYTIVVHQHDQWLDLRSRNNFNGEIVYPEVNSNLKRVIDQSEWRAEYVTVSAFYDFGKFKDYPNLSPLLTVAWDMPIHWSFSRNVYQTHSVSLILQINF